MWQDSRLTLPLFAVTLEIRAPLYLEGERLSILNRSLGKPHGVWYTRAVEIRKAEPVIEFRRRWLAGLVGLLVVLQVMTPSRAWIALLVCLGGTLATGYCWARQMAGHVTLTREQHYNWVHVGDLLEERFSLRNDSPLPIVWVEVDDRSDLPDYSAASVRSAGAHETVEWRIEGICHRRGLFTLGPWQAHITDPFGLFLITFDYPESRSILIYPQVVHLPSLPLARGATTGTGRTSRRTLDVTTNAAGVRQYGQGDSLGRIHWATTAHRDELMVKTFDLEPSGDLWIVLDLDAAVQAGDGEESTEEYGVILAASLADKTLRENRAVALAAYGRHADEDDSEPSPTLAMPQKGMAQQWRILQALAAVHAGGAWPLARVLAEMDRNLGRGMTLAVITPSCDPAWVAGLLPPMRRGIVPVILLLDPATFGGTGNVDALRGLLAQLGVPSHIIAKGMPFKPLVEHRRIGRPEYRVLSGTGRIIAVEW
jgi:uncharacterized protein (DUF58 family)